MRDLPAAVRTKAPPTWLEALPALVAGIAGDWGLTIGDAFGDATEAYVVAVEPAAVLKVHLTQRAAFEEATVLGRAAGCARLLRSDLSRNALLIERLGPPMSEMSIDQPRRLEILCDLASSMWVPAPAVDLPDGATKAAALAAGITRRWEALGRPCSRAAVEQALSAAASRARNGGSAVLCHGDVHQWNALWSGSGYKLIDPDGVRAEPELDLGALMREDPVELMTGDPYDRARLLADRTGTDATAIWEWGLADRVATGLVLLAAGVEPVASEMLAAADHIAGQGSSTSTGRR
ncbi:aminoglycoside phosphotransferase family protein [Actinoplanes sp. NPDC049596]|uniref:aminoglycoside phosphotransferase family protein n=1 Tax=unclassified Actinoplanes TaxID=2626549 RepID=UPI003443B638